MARAKDKRKDQEELAVIEQCKKMLTEGTPVRDGQWTPKEIEILNKQLFLTSKPVIYLVNIGDI